MLASLIALVRRRLADHLVYRRTIAEIDRLSRHDLVALRTGGTEMRREARRQVSDL